MTANAPPDAYRSGVGMMLLNIDDDVFVARRRDMPSPFWQMPQGGIDDGESPRQSALRELKEEIGTNNADIIAESRGWFTYDLPADLVGNLWRGRYRGQRQKWFALRFTGRDEEINIETEHPEFIEWKWVAPWTLPQLIVPFKRALYAELLIEFQTLLPGSAGRPSSSISKS